MKYVLAIAALFVVGAIGYTFFDVKSDSNQVENVNTVSSGYADDKSVEREDGMDDDSVKTQPTTNTTSNVKTFTMQEVAVHNTATSCYSVVNSSVYDLTSWIAKHPGGEAAIKRMCGVDGSAGFTKKHGGQDKPEAALASFKIGELVK